MEMTIKTIKTKKVLLIIALLSLLTIGFFNTFTPVNANVFGVSVSNKGVAVGNQLQATNGATAWNDIIDKFAFFVTGVTGIGTVAMILFFVYNFVKLGSTSDNDSARAKVIKVLIWSAIAAAGLGAVTIFTGF